MLQDENLVCAIQIVFVQLENELALACMCRSAVALVIEREGSISAIGIRGNKMRKW